jgi:ketosteroid isomerase-like protein
MRKTPLIVVMALTVLTLSATALTQPPPQPGAAEQELIALDKRLADAESRGDAAAVEKILAPDYTLVDTTGRVVTRAQALAGMRSAERAHTASMATSDYSVKIYGDVAIMTHAAVMKAGPDATERLRTTHVWVKRDGRWQLSSDQCTAVTMPLMPTNKPIMVAACAEASFSPEVQQFYGSPDTIRRKLSDASIALEKRRVYLLMIETDEGAELTLFDRTTADDPLVRVSQWRGRSVAALREQLTSTIMQNKGVACIGEATKRIVQATYTPTPLARISPPASASEAFSHLLKPYEGTYVRATVLLLC